MKKMIFVMSLLLVQFATAQVREVKRLTTVEAREKVKNQVEYVEGRIREGKGLTDPSVRKLVVKSIENTVKDVVTLSPKQTEGVLKFIEMNPSVVLPEITRQVSIFKDKESSPAEKAQSKKTIELLGLSAHLVDATYRTEADTKKTAEKAKQILELSDKIAGISSGELASKSKDFVEKYEKALKEGKSLEEAVREASGGKFSLQELIDCK